MSGGGFDWRLLSHIPTEQVLLHTVSQPPGAGSRIEVLMTGCLRSFFLSTLPLNYYRRHCRKSVLVGGSGPFSFALPCYYTVCHMEGYGGVMRGAWRPWRL